MKWNSRRVSAWAYAAPTDLRKGFDGLSALVLKELSRDPLSGDLYLFVSRNRIRAKVLHWDGTGLIREWALTQRGLPRSDFGKAVRYMLERWAKLTLFVENPLVYPDNNAAERALRGPVVGRKNHYGSRSKRGTEVAALFYTLCETAKLRNVEPRA